MKLSILPLAVVAVTLVSSCKKLGIPRPGHSSPLLVKQTIRARSHDQVTAFTRSYQYDGQGRLTSIVDEDQHVTLKNIFYNAGGDVDSIVYPGQGVIARRVEVQPFSSANNGDVLRWNELTTDATSNGTDSTVTTFYWDQQRLLSILTYIHNQGFDPLQDSAVYTYTAQGNYLTMQDFPLFPSPGSFETSLGWDTAHNIFAEMPRLNFILIGGQPPIVTRGEHNITQVLTPTGETDRYKYTYNGQGYPLTITLEGEDFDRYTYVYSE